MKFVLLFLLIFSTSANEVVTITGHPDYPPVVWSKDKVLKGTSVTIIKMALENLGYKPVFKNVETWGRAQEEVKLGRIDILLPPYKTPEREAYYSFSPKPFLMDKTALFVKKGETISFKKFEDLNKYAGVAIINDSFGEEFDLADKEHNLLKRLTKTEQCFQFLLKGRADYVIAGQNAATTVLSKLNILHKFEIHEKLIIETGMYTAVSKKSKYNTKEFKDKFFKEVEKLIELKLHLKARKDALKAFSQM